MTTTWFRRGSHMYLRGKHCYNCFCSYWDTFFIILLVWILWECNHHFVVLSGFSWLKLKMFNYSFERSECERKLLINTSIRSFVETRADSIVDVVTSCILNSLLPCFNYYHDKITGCQLVKRRKIISLIVSITINVFRTNKMAER